MRHLATRGAVIVGVLGLAIAGVAWARALRGDRLTGPHHVEWRGPDDRPYVLDELDDSPCHNVLMNDTFVHAGRLVITCTWGETPSGLAWIDPGKGVAKVAWPTPAGVTYSDTTGLAPGPDGSFGVAFAATRGEEALTFAAVAGRDGWTVPPFVLGGDPFGEKGGPRLLGMAWVGEALELVLTRPTSKDNFFGDGRAPEVVRLLPGKPVERTVHPAALGPVDRLVFAMRGPRGWELAIGRDRKPMLVDAKGSLAAAPGAWWGALEELRKTDLAALGLVGSLLAGDAEIAEPDGTRHPIGAPPFPGFVPMISYERHDLVGGVLRTRRLWSRDEDRVLGQIVGGRAIAAASSPDEEVQMVGDRPDRLHPILHSSTSTQFRIGAFLPAPDGGYYWVTGEGEYVTLDRELRRTDPLSLVHHLRTRGSTGDFIDEPEHVAAAGWALFGLPILLALGLLGAYLARNRRIDESTPPLRRASPLTLALGLYAVTGAWALHLVFALL